LIVEADGYLRSISTWELSAFEDVQVNVALNPIPDPSNVVVQRKSIVLKKPIDFQADSAVLAPSSRATLEELAMVLENEADVLLVEVQGHYHGSSSETEALSLSNQRANTVRDALLELGILPGRLEARGYGNTKPQGRNTSVTLEIQRRR
jgi:outer membrane protein OmpA-like peptidoglycan-associated protein